MRDERNEINGKKNYIINVFYLTKHWETWWENKSKIVDIFIYARPRAMKDYEGVLRKLSNSLFLY